MTIKTFALLDDCRATEAAPTSRLYTEFAHERRCVDPRELDAVWAEVRADLAAGLHALVLADYEWGVRLHGLPGPDSRQTGAAGGSGGALRILLFRSLDRLSAARVDDWLHRLELDEIAARDPSAAAEAHGPVAGGEEAGGGEVEGALPALTGHRGAVPDPAPWRREARAPAPAPALKPALAPAGLRDARTSVDSASFAAAIARIQTAIRDGETYQVNYSFRLDFGTFGAPVSLYRRLRARQPVEYGAFIALPPDDSAGDSASQGGSSHILSCSPELFVRLDAGRLLVRPMKGTAARGGDPETDAAIAQGLRADPKTRAENLMIVDLLRNDLGRVARIGSVRVLELFAIETYPELLQMTSTIEAELPDGIDFPALLRALFPSGSITGAPKRRTMQLIADLESETRGLYTGAIGWIDAPAPGRAPTALGDLCLSVAIRTLALRPDPPAVGPDTPPPASWRGRLGIGAGILGDSRAADEFAECLLKANFLTGLDPGFSLIETLHATRAEGIRHRARHLARLAASARRLGFRLPEAAIGQALDRQAATLPETVAFRLRLTLDKDGRFALEAAPLDPPPPEPVGLLLSPDPTDGDDPLCRHKTTWRARYDAAVRAAAAQGAFDMLFLNRAGELTEGGRTNLFLRIDGRWLTPALECGLLPGVMREVLLADPAWNAREARLTLADLARAERILVCNALRGPLTATLLQDRPRVTG